jgi:uncharacterized protein
VPLTLHLHPGEYAVCRLAPDAAVPAWTVGPGFSSVTRTADELSVICLAARVPSGVKSEGGWRLLQLVGPFAFGAVGILSSVLVPLAAAKVSSLAVATFDTDYLLIKAAGLAAAVAAIRAAGHTIREERP